ncbi:MAG: hypothetical protein ACJ8FT_06600 [Sphingomonas sp.]
MILASLLPVLAMSASVPSASEQAGAADDNKIVCQMETVQGSRIDQRICRTKGEWKRLAERAEKEVNAATQRPAQACASVSIFCN